MLSGPFLFPPILRSDRKSPYQVVHVSLIVRAESPVVDTGTDKVGVLQANGVEDFTVQLRVRDQQNFNFKRKLKVFFLQKGMTLNVKKLIFLMTKKISLSFIIKFLYEWCTFNFTSMTYV